LGPYALARAEAGAFALRARAGGVLPEPARDVNVRVVRDENARALRLLAGRADVVPNGLSAPLLGALGARGALVRSRPGANLTYLLPHHGRAPFRDARARRAASLAVDRERLARTLFEGRARAARSFLPPGSWAARPEEAPLPHDPGAAARLFAELGAPAATLLVSTDRARGVLARAIAQDLGDAGLRVEVVTLELGALLQRLTAGDFELALLQMPEITEPQLLEWFFHSRFIPEGGGAGANRARYRNDAVDDRLARAARELDRERRRGLFREALGLMDDDLPVVPLFHEDQVVGLSARAASFRLSAEGRWLGLASVP
ncbi:MAG TPA: ABC transporter substrate-binding protein, partial [Polyangiaceae bacterium]|nr:ABC transporter substrate-binding protein [Polyangiaceae bacterium]